MKHKLIAGNWKMNLSKSEAEQLLTDLASNAHASNKYQLAVCVPAVHLGKTETILANSSIKYGGQNCYTAEKGAFTGENSAATLKSYGCSYVLVGHSERREYFGESHTFLKAKVDTAIDFGLQPIFCFGEKLQEREANHQEAIVKQQLEESVFHLDSEAFSRVVLAYEPVWAIGTGLAASPEQAQEMHAYIRQLIKEQYGTTVANNAYILYGGSMKPANAADLLSQPDIDGGLIGGASLKAQDFLAIAASA
ncbi:MAG: triose-phosphate isomerase [Saprospiraceae bacterium]|nr:triose-phosphate isomerase [Saprospiraceae bacterium]